MFIEITTENGAVYEININTIEFFRRDGDSILIQCGTRYFIAVGPYEAFRKEIWRLSR